MLQKIFNPYANNKLEIFNSRFIEHLTTMTTSNSNQVIVNIANTLK